MLYLTVAGLTHTHTNTRTHASSVVAALMGINYSHQKLLGAIITMLATCDDGDVVDVDDDGSNRRFRLS